MPPPLCMGGGALLSRHDQLMALYNAAEGTSDYDVNLMNIITEQAIR